MTPEQIEFHRNRFEELISEHPSNCKKDKNGRYLKPRIEYLFQGYLMAIESIEIELPAADESDYFSPDYYAGCEVAAGAISEYLQSLGLKVKER